MVAAIEIYGRDRAREVVLNNLRSSSEKYPNTYFTAGSLKIIIQNSILGEISDQGPERIGEIIDETRKVFSKPNLSQILNESPEVASIQVFASGTIETAYRLKPSTSSE